MKWKGESVWERERERRKKEIERQKERERERESAHVMGRIDEMKPALNSFWIAKVDRSFKALFTWAFMQKWALARSRNKKKETVTPRTKTRLIFVPRMVKRKPFKTVFLSDKIYGLKIEKNKHANWTVRGIREAQSGVWPKFLDPFSCSATNVYATCKDVSELLFSFCFSWKVSVSRAQFFFPAKIRRYSSLDPLSVRLKSKD